MINYFKQTHFVILWLTFAIFGSLWLQAPVDSPPLPHIQSTYEVDEQLGTPEAGRHWPYVSPSNWNNWGNIGLYSSRDKNLQFLKTAKEIAALKTQFNEDLRVKGDLSEGNVMTERKEDSADQELWAQGMIIRLAQKALEQDMHFSKRNTEFGGRVQNAIILASAGNNSNINTLEGSIAYLCTRSLAKTIDEKGRLFWGWLFESIQKVAQACLLNFGWGAVLTEENINLLESTAEIIKQQLDLQAKYVTEMYSNAKSMNMRQAKEDQYGLGKDNGNSSDSKGGLAEGELGPLLDLVGFALEEIHLYLYKYKKCGKHLSSDAKVLMRLNDLFSELGKIFLAAGSLENMQPLTKRAQALCVAIVAVCERHLKLLVLSKSPSKRPTSHSYDFFSQRDGDKFG
jgi:hypothetical protein